MKTALQNHYSEEIPFQRKSISESKKVYQKYASIPKEKLYLMLMRFGNELEQSVPLLEERVNFIILFQRIDQEEIENVLNRLLDCITWEMGIDIFHRLINYYHRINPMGAINYQCEFNKIIKLQTN
jgi:hypothetical protein